jgi:DNA-binding HxlR family transcriptional regulator
MKRADRKSHCAVNFALEAIGDPWSLLIVRDIVFDGKHSFNEFLASEERIAKNILASRLSRLEHNGILIKRISLHDRRVVLYSLTEKGIDLIPILFEFSKWSVKYDPDSAASKAFGEVYFKDPIGVTQIVQNAVRQGRAAFAGEDSALRELNIA